MSDTATLETVTAPPPQALVFVDTETTSLRPDREIWEIAMIRHEGLTRKQISFFIKADLAEADAAALRVGMYWDRYEAKTAHSPETAARLIEHFTRGAVLVGSNPRFDAEGMEALLRFWGLCPSWHHRLIDVVPLAAGAIAGRSFLMDDERAALAVPLSPSRISEVLGVSMPNPAHTALADAVWAERLYSKVMASALAGVPS